MTVINGRFVGLHVSGMERYAREVVCRMGAGTLRVVGPRRPMPGLRGQLWEQVILPRRMGAREVLWSPANTGPIHYHPQVVTVHDVAVFDHPEWFGLRVRLAYGTIVARLIRDAHCIITPSAFTRERVIARFGVDTQRVRVVRAGMSADWLWPAVEPEGDSLQTTRLAQIAARRFGLAFGGSNPRKNVGRLVAAWERVRSVVGDLDLVLLGSTARGVFRRGTSLSRPWMQCVRNVTDQQLDRLYRAAEVLVYPSLYEGFGLPPLEALARGTPVVVSDIPALRETLDDVACFVDPWDAESIAGGVMKVVGAKKESAFRPRAGMGERRLPTWETAAQLMTDILTEVAGSGPR